MNSSIQDPSAGLDLAPGGVYIRNLPHIHQNPVAFFLREVQGRMLRHVAREKVSTSGWSVDMLGDYAELLEASDGRDDDVKTWLLRHAEDEITLIELTDGWANIATAGRDRVQVETTCAAVARRVNAGDEGRIVPITFWALDPEKWPRAILRRLETPPWQEVAGNYGSGVVAGMERLFAIQRCPSERMILWHGAPGTGKTHALRALIHEWRSWCDAAFITDPERFVGGSPTYLFQVANFNGGRSASEARKRSKLIILEDAGELMTTEARAIIGQGLSRLLNLTDGLMGQGLNVMVLITTNEPLSSMHPAVVRPGRCLCEMDFSSFQTEEANQWLREHGCNMTVEGPTLLAELYAMASGRITNRSGETVTVG
jgi:ATPase family associated with various cellular activities (AAA)